MKTIREYLENNSLTYEDIAPKISEALEMDEQKVLKVLNTKDSKGNPAGSAYLIRRVEKQKVDKVQELNISGIIISPDTKAIAVIILNIDPGSYMSLTALFLQSF